jgi:hypothetical protein
MHYVWGGAGATEGTTMEITLSLFQCFENVMSVMTSVMSYLGPRWLEKSESELGLGVKGRSHPPG